MLMLMKVVIITAIILPLITAARPSPAGDASMRAATVKPVASSMAKEQTTVLILDVDGCLYDAKCGLEQEVRHGPILPSIITCVSK